MGTWADWMHANHYNRHVGDDTPAPGVRVSTVFLGIDHNFSSDGPPLLFETMIFDDYDSGDMWRYSTWEEAEAGHKSALNEIKTRIKT